MEANLSWEQVEELAKRVAAEIKRSGYEPELLVGIAIGGLVPLALFAKAFDTNAVATIAARSYEGRRKGEIKIRSLPRIDMEGKRVLVIDEIADSGATLRKISALLKERFEPKEVKTATLAIRKDRCEFKPDFHGLEEDKWVVFPWDSKGATKKKHTR